MKSLKHERTARVLFGMSAAVVIVLSGGSAAAFWSGSSLGSGAATTGVSAPLTLSAGSATAGLYPGGSADVAFVASNPNATAVTVTAFALDTSRGTGGFAVDAQHASCAVSALSFSAPQSPSGFAVPARAAGVDGTLPITLAGALSMSAAAASACQGATFTVYLKVAP